MLNDINVKNSRDSSRCKYHLKQATKTRAKNVATNENCILREMVLKFQNPIFMQNSILEQAKLAE